MPVSPDHLSAGRYRIECVLGVGGMSVVLQAYDNRMKVERAIKLLHKRFAGNPQVRERFENEAYAQASLRHQNILMVHDVVEEDVGVYLVMELAEGGSLADQVRQTGPLPPRRVAEIGATLCGALGVAHTEGVIHRDIKPENILVDRHGVLKIADFGIARVIRSDANLTRTGMVMGTWAYMPPEQRENAKGADGRADIYALGATLFFLLTARAPSAMHNPETHTKAYTDIPLPLAKVIQKATRLYPEDRYQTCAELATDLRELIAELSTERIFEFVPADDLATGVGTDLVDLSEYLADKPEAAETLAPLLSSLTAIPDGPAASAPSLFLAPPPPGAHQASGSETMVPADLGGSAQLGVPDDPSPGKLQAQQRLQPQPREADRRAVTGGQLMIFTLGIMAAVSAMIFLGPRLSRPAKQAAPTVQLSAPLSAPPGDEAPDAPALTPADVPAEAPAEAPAEVRPPTLAATPSPAATTQPVPITQPVPTSTPMSSGSTDSSSRQPRVIQIVPLAASTSGSASSSSPALSGDPSTGAAGAQPVEPTGLVVVRTIPSGAAVLEGSTTLHRTGRGYALSVGSHVLLVRSPDGEQTTIPVIVKRDQTVEICYSFDTNSACSAN